MKRGLRSQEQEAERVARELMDVKIEAAHLRERLRMRVGGDTTAAELEAEAFALQTALSEAQQTLKAREVALETLEIKYEQAMRGMMQLDEAWKLRRNELIVMQKVRETMEQQIDEEKQRSEALQAQVAAGREREVAITGRVKEVIKEKEKLEMILKDVKQEMTERELTIQELSAELETTRCHFDMQLKQQEGATREDVRRLQDQLQQTQEQAAALRGEVGVRQKEAIQMETELRDMKAAHVVTKQRLVKLTEDYATLCVHLESAKGVAGESTQRAIEAESKIDRMRKEVKERDDVLVEKTKSLRTLEEELVQMQKTMEEEMNKKKKAAEDIQQRLKLESQEMLQAQEETWSCREKNLQQEVDNLKLELIRVQAFHVELAQLLQVRDGDYAAAEKLQSVEPGMLQALVVQVINKHDILTSALKQMRIQAGITERQLGSQKQLETENVRLRAEYEKAKLAMERMATRKARSFACLTTSLPVQSASLKSGYSSSSEKSGGKENNHGKEGEVAPMVKRQLEASKTDTAEFKTTPRKARRTKHVYVASRYMSSASKR